MAEYISFQPSDFFNTTLYTGNGSTQTITGVGFQPDATWIKERNGTEYHRIYDSVRGATKEIYPNSPGSGGTNANSLTSWNADGFAVGTETGVNNNTDTFVAWNWKAGTTSGLSGGTITPSAYSFNTTTGISILQYTGTGSAGTIPHGLGAVPKFIIFKSTATSDNWIVYHHSIGATKNLTLDATDAAATSSTPFNDTTPTSTVFSVGTSGRTNGSAQVNIAYCFAEIQGFSKFGGYTGNGNADGVFVYTGFRPAYVMCKYTGVEHWAIVDDKRLGYNVANYQLYADATNAEVSNVRMDILSNGFKARTANAEWNGSGNSYVYAAFAEFPIVSSNDTPGVAR